MSNRLSCPQGHQWDDQDGLSGAGVCPVCGLAAQTVLGPITPLPGATEPEDETPPPLGPPLTRRPVGLPTIPGHTVLEVIGRGGQGYVYRARQARPNRLVALKVIGDVAAAGPAAVRRFLAESETVARLQHPHIVHVYEAGEHRGTPYFTMELVEGGSLARRTRGVPQPARAAAALVETLARAVHHAHQRGVIHRDLKPGNVLLHGPAGAPLEQLTPKVADFGLAKHLDVQAGLTSSGGVKGTPEYMAPEQARGDSQEVGPATDVYALGVILYELLTGRRPFQGRTDAETLIQVISDDPPPPSRWRKVPKDLNAVCEKCLQKRPRDRYASAEQLAGELRHFLDGEPLPHTRPVGEVERLWRWCRRKPALAALHGLAATALATALVAHNDASAGRFRALYADCLRKAEEALNQAHAALDRGEGAQGMLLLARALEAAPPSADDLQRLVRMNLASYGRELSPLQAMLPHPGEVIAVGFGGDGRVMLTADARAVRLWNVASGKLLRLLKPPERIASATLSPDGRWILTGGEDGTARLWDAATGAQVGAGLGHGARVQAVAFAPDGRTAVTGSWDQTAKLWRLTPGGAELVAMVKHPGRIFAVALCPRGETLLTGGDGGARLWDVATRQARELDTKAQVWAVCFSPDGKEALTGGTDRAAQRWDVATGQPAGRPFPHRETVSAVAFSPDGVTALTGSWDKTARFWDVATGRPLGLPLAHGGKVLAAAYGPDGRSALTGNADRNARFWEKSRTNRPAFVLAHDGKRGFVRALAFSPDGTKVLTGSTDGTAYVWDTATGRRVGQVLQHCNWVHAVAFSPDGRTALTGSWDHTARLWDATTGEPWGTDPVTGLAGICLRHDGPVWAVAFSPDGRTILTGCEDGHVRLWRVADGRLLWSFPQRCKVFAVAYSPNGRTALIGGEDDTARLVDVATGLLRHEFRHPGGRAVFAVAFRADGKAALCGTAGRGAQLWHLGTDVRPGPLLPHGGRVYAATFGRGGRLALTASADHTASVWNVQTGNPQGAAMHHAGAVQSAVFRPDGFIVLTGSEDGHARLWDAAGKPCGPPLRHRDRIFRVAFSPDGMKFLTGCGDNAVWLWAAPAPLAGSPRQLALAVRVQTGWEFASGDAVQPSDAATWHECRRLLHDLDVPAGRKGRVE
jgi:WD40 repeat protein